MKKHARLMQALDDLSHPERIRANREFNRRIEEAKAAAKARHLIRQLEQMAREH